MVESEDKKQLKFIEILLIVGGIIGGLEFKSGDSSSLLTLFLISSLMYYYLVSNPPLKELYKRIFAIITSILFAALITVPLMSSTPATISFWGPSYPKFNIITNYIGAICLSALIFINLQDKSELESGKVLNLKNFIVILIGTSLALSDKF